MVPGEFEDRVDKVAFRVQREIRVKQAMERSAQLVLRVEKVPEVCPEHLELPVIRGLLEQDSPVQKEKRDHKAVVNLVRQDIRVQWDLKAK